MASEQGRRLSPHAEMMYQVLSDGRWHPFEVVLQQMARLIPAGQAVRNVERNRRRRGGPPRRRRPISLENLVLAGQRRYALDVVQQHIRGGRIEQRVDQDGTRQVRQVAVPPPSWPRKRGER